MNAGQLAWKPNVLSVRDHKGADPLCLRDGGQFLGLGEAVAQRPLAKDHLSRFECGQDQFAVMRDLDGHDHQVDLVGPYEFLGAAEGSSSALPKASGIPYLSPAALADVGLLADSARTS